MAVSVCFYHMIRSSGVGKETNGKASFRYEIRNFSFPDIFVIRRAIESWLLLSQRTVVGMDFIFGPEEKSLFVFF